MKWESLRAVVTGAAGGLGAQLVHDLGTRGVRVAAWDIDPSGLERLTASAAKLGHDVTPIEADVSKETKVREAARVTSKALGGIDLWFNYAGFAKIGEFQNCSAQEWQRTVDVNLMGVIWGTRVALEMMETRGRGSIINMASAAGHFGSPYLAAYSTTKHAVVGFTRSLSCELKLRNSGVNLVLVSPGFVDTQMISLGDQLGFPEWLKWTLSTPEAVSQEVLRGIEKGKSEIYPTLNGKIMLRLQKTFPSAVTPASRALLSKSLKDFLLNRTVSTKIS